MLPDDRRNGKRENGRKKEGEEVNGGR